MSSERFSFGEEGEGHSMYRAKDGKRQQWKVWYKES